MMGLINTETVLLHPMMIVREFGLGFYMRCLHRVLLGGKRLSFLDLLHLPREATARPKREGRRSR